MGLPIHCLEGKYKDAWIDKLRQEIGEHATVEMDDACGSNEQSVYVVGNCGYFTLNQTSEPESDMIILMEPFNCTAEKDGQGMVNLEERIHRTLDPMSVVLQPEEIGRYEKKFSTRLFRLFGWEHVGSLDFAHRPKKEIVEGDFDLKIPTKKRINPDCTLRGKPEYQSDWGNFFKNRLKGVAKITQMEEKTVVSPNGMFQLTLPMHVHIESEANEVYDIWSVTGRNGYRLNWPFPGEPGEGNVGSSPVDHAILRILQELLIDELNVMEKIEHDLDH